MMPPVLADDLALVNLVDIPQAAVALLVEEDGLEDVAVKVDLGRELGLVVCAVEAHFQLAEVGLVRLDEVHGPEVLLGILDALGLVFT